MSSQPEKTLIATIEVVGNPLAKNKKRAQWVKGVPKIYPDQSHVPWTSLIIQAACNSGLEGKRLLGTYRTDCRWRFRRPNGHFKTKGGMRTNDLKDSVPVYVRTRPDRDNLDKAVLDALTQAGVWVDDAQAATGMLERCYCNPGEAPGCTITIWKLED